MLPRSARESQGSRPTFQERMTRLRFAVLVLIGAAFLCAPLGALCSACCVPADGMSAPMPCCGDTCGPSFTAARSHDPAMSEAKTKLNPPLGNVLLPPHSGGLTLSSKPLPATFSAAAPTESPPVSNSVLRL